MHKSCQVHIKAAGVEDGLQEGQFRALVSVFNNKDSYGDVVMPGAFTDTLAAWGESEATIPLYWSHQMADPDMNIGWVLEAKETEAGLEVLAQLDVEAEAPAKARQAYRLLKGRRVDQFSFAYDVLDGSPSDRDGDEVFELRKLKLHEVSITPVGANSETELLAVKARAMTQALASKRGREVSAKNEGQLREALTAIEDAAALIKNVLAAVEDGSEDEQEPAPDEASTDAPGNGEEPEKVNPEDPKHAVSVDTWATQIKLARLEYSA